MVMSRDKNVGWIHVIKIGNSSSEVVEEFKYFRHELKELNFYSGRN